MILVEALEDFNLKDFKKVKNIKRYNKNVEGVIFAKDVFECSQDFFDYLSGNNKYKKAFIKIIEIVPDKPVEIVEKVVEKPKRGRKKKEE